MAMDFSPAGLSGAAGVRASALVSRAGMEVRVGSILRYGLGGSGATLGEIFLNKAWEVMRWREE